MLGHHREDVVEVMGQLGGSGLLPGVQRQQRRRRWHTAFGALAPPTHPTLDVIAAERFGTLKKIIIKKAIMPGQIQAMLQLNWRMSN